MDELDAKAASTEPRTEADVQVTTAAPSTPASSQAVVQSKDAAVAIVLDSIAQPEHEGIFCVVGAFSMPQPFSTKRQSHAAQHHALLNPLICAITDSGSCPSDSGRLDKEQVKRLKTKSDGSFKASVAAATVFVRTRRKQQQQQERQQQLQQQQDGGESLQGPGHSASGEAPCASHSGREHIGSGAAVQTFTGRSADQLLADVDAVAAHVSGVLLPRLRGNERFEELLQQARVAREKAQAQAQAQLALKAQEREAKRARGAVRRGEST